MAEVVVKGIKPFIAALDAVEPALDAATKTELKKVAAVVAERSRAAYPATDTLPSGFTHVNKSGLPPVSHTSKKRAFPRYDRTTAAAGTKVTERQGKRKYRQVGRNVYGFVNEVGIAINDAAANIVETAGTRHHGGETANGGRLIRGISAATGVGIPLYKVVLPQIVKARPNIDFVLHRTDVRLTTVGNI